jgi:hypothetical protein
MLKSNLFSKVFGWVSVVVGLFLLIACFDNLFSFFSAEAIFGLLLLVFGFLSIEGHQWTLIPLISFYAQVLFFLVFPILVWGEVLVVLPVVMIFGITFGIHKTLALFKIHSSVFITLMFSYAFVSGILLLLQYQERPSEFFGVPYLLAPSLLSCPFGILIEQISRVFDWSYLITYPLTIMVGIVQWSLIWILVKKWKLKTKSNVV